MIDTEEFTLWCRYFKRQPFDDQSNHHMPIANLHAGMVGMMGSKANLVDFLIFRKRENSDEESLLMNGNW